MRYIPMLLVTVGGCLGHVGLRASGGAAESTRTISTELVKNTLFAELHASGRGPTSTQLDAVENLLRPMYAALPKSGAHADGLNDKVVQYALHRFFEQQYGWHLKGLGVHEDGVNGSVPVIVQAGRAPAFIISLVEEGLQGRGVNLHELAVLAATLQDLVHADNTQRLLAAYVAQQIPPETRDANMIELTHETYMALLMLGDRGEPLQKLPRLVGKLRKLSTWAEEREWMLDARPTSEWKAHERINPFAGGEHGIARREQFAEDVVQQLARYHDDINCHQMKAALLAAEDVPGSSRVRLDRFHRIPPAGPFSFEEPLEYLRAHGLADETDPETPKVILSNYVNARTNCLHPGPSNFYTVCCLDQCLPLLQRLEGHAAAPTMKPQLLLHVVSALPSETVAAPRNLSVELGRRLEQIAAQHGGEVPLHGRLFAQWMHHAFPNECSYPQAPGGKPLRMQLDAWLETAPETVQLASTNASQGASQDVSMLSVEGFVDDEAGGVDLESAGLPWTEDEELLAGDLDAKLVTPKGSLGSRFRALALAVAIASCLTSLRRVLQTTAEALPLYDGGIDGKPRYGRKIL